jgi:hypothetical protein
MTESLEAFSPAVVDILNREARAGMDEQNAHSVGLCEGEDLCPLVSLNCAGLAGL